LKESSWKSKLFSKLREKQLAESKRNLISKLTRKKNIKQWKEKKMSSEQGGKERTTESKKELRKFESGKRWDLRRWKKELRVIEASEKSEKVNYVCYQEWKRSLMKIGGRMLRHVLLFIQSPSMSNAKLWLSGCQW